MGSGGGGVPLSHETEEEVNHHPCLVWPDSVVPLWLAVLLGRQYDGSRTTLTRVNPEVVVVGGNGHPLPAGRGSDRLAGL